MIFTKAERLILLKQLQILRLLDQDGNEHYEEMEEIISNGYSLLYEDLTQELSEEFPESCCREVMDILDMYRALKFSYEELPDKSGIDPSAVRFRGFDGNYEAPYLRFAKFLVDKQQRWQESRNEVVNSHAPMLPKYRKMLVKWKQIEERHELTKEEIEAITSREYAA